MLSAETIGVIKLTVPVLAAHGETLTRHFYKRMFTGNPETLALFNPAHQHTGGQQKALAAAICAYAQHIETPEVLSGAIELIAQKHASLGIRPDHYPIVGKHLLGSIQEVLGEGATPAVIAAWGAAYQFLADVLIKREAEIYRQHEHAHGWCGFEPFVVVKKQVESATITSFHLARRSGEALKPFAAGQYVTVRVPTAGGHSTTMRNYSLSCGPGAAHYRISVKREAGLNADTPGGYVSNYLHDKVNVGDVVQVGPPCGEFTLRAGERPVVLMSGGVGITPMLSMLHAAAAAAAAGGTRRDVYFVHAAINGQTHAFREEVLAVAERHDNVRVHFRYSAATREDRERELCDSEGLVDAALFAEVVGSAKGDFYLCGPKPFMAAAHRALTSFGVSREAIYYEFFGPQAELKEEALAER